MPIEPITPSHAVEVLNELLALDPALSELLKKRVSCSEALADHPTVQVGTSDGYTLGFVGLLNGLFGTDDEGYGPIALEIDTDTLEPIRFVLLDGEPLE